MLLLLLLRFLEHFFPGATFVPQKSRADLALSTEYHPRSRDVLQRSPAI